MPVPDSPGDEQLLTQRIETEHAVYRPKYALHVDVVEVSGVSRHVEPEEREVRQIAELCGNIVGRELPVGYLFEITLVGARLVSRRAARGVCERPVGHEVHRRHRSYGRRIAVGGRPQLVAELLVLCARYVDDAEIAGCESCEAAVAAPVVVVRIGILGRR